MKKLILLAIPLLLLSACNKQIEPIKNTSPKEATVSNLQLLQGSWVSDDDKDSIINFSGQTKSDLYEGSDLIKENFKLYNHYPITKDSQEDENGQYLIVDNIEENFEYKIIELDEENLTLIYLARGNSLKYYKQNSATAEKEFNNKNPVASALECQTHTDCETPFEFLIQSNCPFASACIANECRVICPLSFHDKQSEISISYAVQCKSDKDCNCNERNDKTLDCLCLEGSCVSVETN